MDRFSDWRIFAKPNNRVVSYRCASKLAKRDFSFSGFRLLACTRVSTGRHEAIEDLSGSIRMVHMDATGGSADHHEDISTIGALDVAID